MEFAFQELWGQKANINTMMLISKIWHIICLFWQFSFVSRMLIGNSFWHILHYPFYKVTINDFVAIFMDDIDEVVLGHICKSNMAIQVLVVTYINHIVSLADSEIILISKSVRFMINIYSIKLDRYGNS